MNTTVYTRIKYFASLIFYNVVYCLQTILIWSHFLRYLAFYQQYLEYVEKIHVAWQTSIYAH